MAAITISGVSKEFRRHNCRNRWLRREMVNLISGKRTRNDSWMVLHGMDFEIKPGETVAILGRNGSGKSTLLKLMAGILQPTEGRIITHGSICVLLDVGTGFHDDLTGRENVFVNGAILGLPRKYLKTILPEIECFAELESFMDTPLKYYSSGMRARLGFAVAMSAEPDIFLIDEVLAVGDEGFRRKCYARLDELVSRGSTIVIVSHDMRALQRLCRRGIWLEDGRIRSDGQINQVCEQYIGCFDAQSYAER